MNKWANELNRQFSKEVQMTNKYTKHCPISLAIKEMQIKAMVKIYLTLRAIIKKTNNNKCW
jgi:hypothetical protein